MLGGRLAEPLRSRDYRCLWLGQLVSVIGDKVNQIALGILVYEATGSGLQMGIVLALSMLPAALFGMVAGAYVDRFDKRRTMIVADLLRAVLVLSVPFVAEYSIVAVYAVALLVATVSLFFEPAKLSLIPKLVDEEQLMAANSLDNATVSAAELAGLAFAAGLVASMGTRLAFFLDSATFLVSALFIFGIGHRETRQSGEVAPTGGVWADVVEGTRYIWQHDLLRDLLLVYSAATAAVAAAGLFFYVLALEKFDGGAPGLAVMDGAITVGLLIGSILIGRTGAAGAVRKLLWGLTVFAGLYWLLAVVPTVAWSIPLLLVMGVANMFFYVPMSTVLQTMTVPSMTGRAFAAKQTLSRTLSVGGYLAAGALTEKLGLQTSIILVGGFMVTVAAIGWLRPALRRTVPLSGTLDLQ
ncbi:MAG: MFS transporter [Coriobacteriia bacterium]|nr:MFS transporter [Coriobacteriia bacterium]